jgi:hypothetical protein
MVLGQTSYFVAARRVAQRLAHDEAAGAGPTPVADPGAATAVAPDPAPSAALVEELAEDPGAGAGSAAGPDAEPAATPGRLTRARVVVERRVRTHAMATVFVVSALPSPLTTLATSAAAATGLPYLRFLPASFAGFLVLTTILVLFGQGLLTWLRSLSTGL